MPSTNSTTASKKTYHFSGVRGFTLIEVIITLVLASILGTMVVTFMRSSLADSALTLGRVSNTFHLTEVMENISAHNLSLLADPDDPTPLQTLSSDIGPAGQSVVTNAFGSYIVVFNDNITFSCDVSNVCTETTGGSLILKVTIADPANQQRVTSLFAQ